MFVCVAQGIQRIFGRVFFRTIGDSLEGRAYYGNRTADTLRVRAERARLCKLGERCTRVNCPLPIIHGHLPVHKITCLPSGSCPSSRDESSCCDDGDHP